MTAVDRPCLLPPPCTTTHPVPDVLVDALNVLTDVGGVFCRMLIANASEKGERIATSTLSPPTTKDGVPHYMGLSGDRLIMMITAIATCGFLLFGYDQGVMSGIVSAPQFYRIFPDLNPDTAGKNQASVMQAFYTAIYEVGCLAGAIFALFFGNKLGRRRNIMQGGFWVIIGAIIQITFTRPVPSSSLARIVTGFGNGLNTATIPSWQAECSKSHNRGLHICIEASMIATGHRHCIIFAVILIFGVLQLPESPRYLLSTRQYAEGENVVAALAALLIDHEDTQLQKRVIVEALESVGELEIKHVLAGGPSQHLRRTLIGASSQLFQQIGGCNRRHLLCVRPRPS
ncbi:hypothetical protein BD626DRAFT_579016 [Schizophyllum amplum]|uniref:Major facilitator superfamily (MFS) profile domain-containing protein n=1 Tax=Schizophyllum amplum TaxID=97359 RepID=A0A550BRS3_9AGAR|nr:hypothetical protein BD626DRAFT_579016 [Auriculariopsis ampla]